MICTISFSGNLVNINGMIRQMNEAKLQHSVPIKKGCVQCNVTVSNDSNQDARKQTYSESSGTELLFPTSFPRWRAKTDSEFVKLFCSFGGTFRY